MNTQFYKGLYDLKTVHFIIPDILIPNTQITTFENYIDINEAPYETIDIHKLRTYLLAEKPITIKVEKPSNIPDEAIWEVFSNQWHHEQTIEENNKLFSKSSFYDVNGIIKQDFLYDEKENDYIYSNTYDSNGNLIEKDKFQPEIIAKQIDKNEWVTVDDLNNLAPLDDAFKQKIINIFNDEWMEEKLNDETEFLCHKGDLRIDKSFHINRKLIIEGNLVVKGDCAVHDDTYENLCLVVTGDITAKAMIYNRNLSSIKPLGLIHAHSQTFYSISDCEKGFAKDEWVSTYELMEDENFDIFEATDEQKQQVSDTLSMRTK